ncbi:MAG TPA: type 1 glutamine amidotransferase domain-containing protein [Verrucomicrobiae bacterium]|nr:type 1 glutamine amidotransferase domain-containing protein [Verrucomicrobiae bacterium]
MADLKGKKVAILVDDYFEEAEFTGPLNDLKKAGAEVEVIAPKAGEIHGMNHVEIADTFRADKALDDVKIDEYDALVLPGGAVNADQLRMNDKARIWIKQFMNSGKPVAAICHAPWALASAGVAKGRRLTSFFTIQDDMRNAGANWVNEEVVIDSNLITSRKPDDVPAFDNALIEMLQAA